MEYEVTQDKHTHGGWRVEAIDYESGNVYIATFLGLGAEKRAREYALFKSRKSCYAVGVSRQGPGCGTS